MLWSNRSKYPPQRFMQNSFKNCGCNFQAHHLTGSFKTPQRDVNLGASAPLSYEPQQLSCCDLIRVAYRPDGPLAPPPAAPATRLPVHLSSSTRSPLGTSYHGVGVRRRRRAHSQISSSFLKILSRARQIEGMKEA